MRLGLPATQWTTVYNAHRPMKQRYHYNVANMRVEQHVVKGNDDGLFISSVACCQARAPPLARPAPSWHTAPGPSMRTTAHVIPRAALQELWALIMDAGTTYTAQTYNLTAQFLPKEWIMEKWEEGFYITAMAGSNSGWSLVAMSKGTAYTQQSYKVRSRGAHRPQCGYATLPVSTCPGCHSRAQRGSVIGQSAAFASQPCMCAICCHFSG